MNADKIYCCRTNSLSLWERVGVRELMFDKTPLILTFSQREKELY